MAPRCQGSLFDGAGRLCFQARSAVKRLKAADPKLAAIIERVGPFRLRLEVERGPYESLFEAVVYQQLSGRAAATILGRAKALFEAGRFPTPREILDTPADLLRTAGLSRPKIAALKDLALKALGGGIPCHAALERMGDEEIVERLTEVRGVGRWTVEMLLIFRLGRPDVLPLQDYGLRRGFSVMLGRKAVASPQQLARRGERWRPFRTVASWYLWRAAEGLAA